MSHFASLLCGCAAASSFDGNTSRATHLKPHYATYHRAGEVLLDYGDGSDPLTHDDLAFGYELMLAQHGKLPDFEFMGIKSQQDPMDLYILQELFFKLRPDLIIELGTWCACRKVQRDHHARDDTD